MRVISNPGLILAALVFLSCAPLRAAVRYPASEPQVLASSTSVTVLFPEKVGVRLSLRGGRGPFSIEKLFVGDREVLSAPDGEPEEPDALGIYRVQVPPKADDWKALLAERQKDKGRWPRREKRDFGVIRLSAFEYAGHKVVEKSVSLLSRYSDRDRSGTLEWIFTPAKLNLQSRTYSGLGWQFRLTGLPEAAWLRVREPASILHNHWTFAQLWGRFVEERLKFDTELEIPDGWYGADMQPFFFQGGPYGAMAAFFERPLAARVSLSGGRGRLNILTRFPIGDGTDRATPKRFWFWNGDELETKWDALNEWTDLQETIGGILRGPYALRLPAAGPTLSALWPGAEAYADYRLNPKMDQDGWFRSFARLRLDGLAGLGFKHLQVQSPWESDADHPEKDFLPGSGSISSAHSPWNLEISSALGGRNGLKVFVRRAHELGMKVSLWLPLGRLSNSSPLLAENPDWVKYGPAGTPETAGEPDVAGVALQSAYAGYVLARIREIREETGIDGLGLDSFRTLALLPDHSSPHPSPELDRMLQLLKEFRKMGLEDLTLDGAGPYGTSSGGYLMEAHISGGGQGREFAAEKFRALEGKEYGLSRYAANCLIEPDSYFRALAAGGAVDGFNLEALNRLSGRDLGKILQANRDFTNVASRMVRRRLIGKGDRWQGVSWTRPGSREAVLFSFEKLTVEVPGGGTVEDVTAGKKYVPEGAFKTAPMRVYVIR